MTNPATLKDHQIAVLINELRDIALKYHDTQQLRERITQAVLPALRAALPDIKDMRNGPQQLNPNDRALWVLGWNECRDAVRAARAAKGGAA